MGSSNDGLDFFDVEEAGSANIRPSSKGTPPDLLMSTAQSDYIFWTDPVSVEVYDEYSIFYTIWLTLDRLS